MLLQMFAAGAVFLVIAVVAALFGFGVVSDETPLAAKLCAGFFLLASAAAFGWAWLNRAEDRRTGAATREREPQHYRPAPTSSTVKKPS